MNFSIEYSGWHLSICWAITGQIGHRTSASIDIPKWCAWLQPRAQAEWAEFLNQELLELSLVPHGEGRVLGCLLAVTTNSLQHSIDEREEMEQQPEEDAQECNVSRSPMRLRQTFIQLHNGHANLYIHLHNWSYKFVHLQLVMQIHTPSTGHANLYTYKTGHTNLYTFNWSCKFIHLHNWSYKFVHLQLVMQICTPSTSHTNLYTFN